MKTDETTRSERARELAALTALLTYAREVAIDLDEERLALATEAARRIAAEEISALRATGAGGGRA